MKVEDATISVTGDVVVDYREKIIENGYLNLRLKVKKLILENNILYFEAEAIDPKYSWYAENKKFLFDCIVDEDFKQVVKYKFPELFV